MFWVFHKTTPPSVLSVERIFRLEYLMALAAIQQHGHHDGFSGYRSRKGWIEARKSLIPRGMAVRRGLDDR
ncbi:hypothetical protein F2Q68_00037308 [Brassica cretica]|uniref:Uncharacterized protein n=1 Tax=Brassica cretica TaxID=69181 RepID=A0A8S9H7U5_BRACR|nr:hypothetical protein F2Q68_00037308 [Brassica cretica]